MQQAYKVKVRPLHERKELINLLAAPSNKTVESWDVFEGKPETLKEIRLPIDVPIYRMANGRTQIEQLAWIAEHKLPEDFFEAGEENASAQQAQHHVLTKFAEQGTDSITPIIEELARTGQTEPILITPSGVVVNGNRRLSAMRELLESGKHANFADISCLVLPALTPEQIDDIEVRLQMRPETKLPYGWANDALKIKKKLASGTKKSADVERLMRRDKKEIEKAVTALSYADIYLKTWKSAPHDYRLVADGRQFFYDLVPRLKGKEGGLLEANMRMAWILFDNRLNLGSRIYDFNKVIGEKAEEVLEKLAERVEIDSEGEHPEEVPEADGSELEIEIPPESGKTGQYASLIDVLDDEARRDELVEELKVVCQIIIDKGKAHKAGNSALMAARDANTSLTEIDLSKADPKTFAGIEKQLEEILVRASNLKEKLKDIISSAPSGKSP